MTMTTATPSIHNPSPANLPFIHCWNDLLTPKWFRFRHLLSGAGQVHSDVAFASLPLRPGDHVVDLGCGFGETTLELADRVGPGGAALGVDCTRGFIEVARQEQATAGVPNARYQLADVETAPLAAAAFDAAVSRFGIMFCASPVRALRNTRRALRGGGILGLLTWRALADNPCWAAAEQVALAHLPRPGDDGVSCGPGPFSMADDATNERILRAAGFDDVKHQRIDRQVCVGRDLAEAVDYQLLVGPAGFVVREAGERGEARKHAIAADLRTLLSGFARQDGSIWMASSTWFITARTPA